MPSLRGMRILLVSYFFPPAQNVASERWGRFSSELKRKGHDVEVICGPWARDPSRGGDNTVAVHYLADPLSADATLVKPGSNGRGSPSSRWRRLLTTMLPTFLFIDGKWLWGINALRCLGKLGHEPGDLVVVTGTPWSAVALVSLYCRLRGRPYAVDFRDLWSNEPFLETFRSTASRLYFTLLERFALRNARFVITVNERLASHFRAVRGNSRVLIMPHGFSGELMGDSRGFNITANHDPIIFYAGSIASHHGMDEFLKVAVDCGVTAHLRFRGRDYKNILERHGLSSEPDVSGPALDEELHKAAVLLLTLAPSSSHYTTGKLMSYIKACRPILYFGPADSPAASLIRDHGIGWVVDSAQPEGLAAVLKDVTGKILRKEPFSLRPELDGLRRFSTDQLVEALEKELTHDRLATTWDIPSNSRT